MRDVHGHTLINKYFQFKPRLPVITLTNSNAKTITIPEDESLYSFGLRICNTILVTLVLYFKYLFMKVWTE